MYNSEKVDFWGPVRFLVFIHQFNSHLWASCNVPGLYLVLEASSEAINQHPWSLPHHTPLFLWESKQGPAEWEAGSRNWAGEELLLILEEGATLARGYSGKGLLEELTLGMDREEATF